MSRVKHPHDEGLQILGNLLLVAQTGKHNLDRNTYWDATERLRNADDGGYWRLPEVTSALDSLWTAREHLRAAEEYVNKAIARMRAE